MKVVIIGGGKVGAYIASLLLSNNYSVKIIENRESVFEKLKKEFPEDVIVYGSGTDPAILEAAGIAGTDVVAAVTGADETNLVASTIVKYEFGISRVIAKVNNPQNAWLFNSGMGVDVCLNQADLMAHLVVEEIDMKNILTLMKLYRGSYSISEIVVDSRSQAAGKIIKELGIPANAVLISISREDKIIIPRGDTAVYGGDKILLFAEDEAQAVLNKLFGYGV